MTIPAENHPGHTLLALSALPPDEALNAWTTQLMADLDSHRTTGVLIHGGLIGGNLQDHGLEPIIEMFALALASMINSTLADNNWDERHRPIEEVIPELFAQIREHLERDIAHRLMDQLQTRYRPTLIEWENDRRVQEAQDEERLRQDPQ